MADYGEIFKTFSYLRANQATPYYPSTGNQEFPTKEANPRNRVIWHEDIEDWYISGFYTDEETQETIDYEYDWYAWHEPVYKAWQINDQQMLCGDVSCYFNPIIELNSDAMGLSSVKCYPSRYAINGDCYWESGNNYLSLFTEKFIVRKVGSHYCIGCGEYGIGDNEPHYFYNNDLSIHCGNSWWQFDTIMEMLGYGNDNHETASPNGRYSHDPRLSSYNHAIDVKIYYDKGLTAVDLTSIAGLSIETLSNMERYPPGGVIGINTPEEIFYDQQQCYAFEIGKMRDW